MPYGTEIIKLHQIYIEFDFRRSFVYKVQNFVSGHIKTRDVFIFLVSTTQD